MFRRLSETLATLLVVAAVAAAEPPLLAVSLRPGSSVGSQAGTDDATDGGIDAGDATEAAGDMSALPERADDPLAGDVSYQEAERLYGRKLGDLLAPPGQSEDDEPVDRSDFPQANDLPPLRLADVLEATAAFYPLLTQSELELAARDGGVVEALGEFDTRLTAFSDNKNFGFYENNRLGFAVTQPLADSGGEVGAGYRLGRGVYSDWYRFRETEKGGEVFARVKQPLLQGRAIDKRRTALRTAELQRRAAEPLLRRAVLQFTREASLAYWTWVGAGLKVRVARDLTDTGRRDLKLVRDIEEEGALAPIVRLDRQRVLALREAKQRAAELKFQQAAVKLGLFLRDADGRPLLAGADVLPADFPELTLPLAGTLGDMIGYALGNRPDLRETDLKMAQTRVKLALACNQQMAKLDAYAYASQDFGGNASKSNDKGQFELEAGLEYLLPVQRRAARGAEQRLRAELAQLAAERRFKGDKIASEVQAALAALLSDYRQVARTRESLRLARQVERLEREQFFGAEGGDVFKIISREKTTADTASLLVDESVDFFASLADYHAAVGQVPVSARPSDEKAPPAPVVPQSRRIGDEP